MKKVIIGTLVSTIIGAKGGGSHTKVEWTDMRCLDEYADLREEFILEAD